MKNILIKKTKKYFLHIIFIHKNGKKILSKTQKKKLQKETHERYQNLSEEGKKNEKRLQTDIKIFLKKKKSI